MKKIGIIGCGGHSKVIIDLINELGKYDIIGFFDDNKTNNFYNYRIIGKISEIQEYKNTIDCFVIAIGNDNIRKKIYEENFNLNWEILIHPKTIISKNIIIDIGTVIFAGAIIQTEVIIGKHCIINTGCSIDHETIICDYCSISPKATLCGNIIIGECSFIGANSTIIQKIKIGKNCIIGAGSVIIYDILDNLKVVGNPGRIIK